MKRNLLLLFSILLTTACLQAQRDSTHFVTTWRTYLTIPGSAQSNDSSIHLGVDPNYTYNYDVDWNDDGIFDDIGVTTEITHQYPDTGTYTVRIKGVYPKYGSGILNPNTYSGDIIKLISIDQWGTYAWEDFEWSFSYHRNMKYKATDTPNLSKGPSLNAMFVNCRQFNGAVGNWDVSRIKNMGAMFAVCFAFDQDLSGWQVDSVTNMRSMFSAATSFNQDLSAWNTSSVTNMDRMFSEAYSFDQDISSWDLSSLVSMERMFYRANAFNQDISALDVSHVKNMKQMFYNNTAFDQDISAWDVSRVTTMEEMFKNATAFNQDLSAWNVDSVTTFRGMFEGATSFNQSLGNWNIPANVFNLLNMLDSTNLSIINYDSTLIGLYRSHPSFIYLGAGGLEYCYSENTRNAAINSGWNINGDSKDCITVGIEEQLSDHGNNKGYSVYPNPSRGAFNLVKETPGKAELFIYSTQGKLLSRQTVEQGLNFVQLNEAKPGVYVLQLEGKTNKMVVTK